MTEGNAYRRTYRDPEVGDSEVPCMICGEPLRVALARGRKSGKPSVMLICPSDGRHFRAFINDRGYVSRVVDRLEART